MAEDTPVHDVPEELSYKLGMVQDAIKPNMFDGPPPMLGLLKSEFDGDPVWVLACSTMDDAGSPTATYPIAIMVTNEMVDRLKEPK